MKSSFYNLLVSLLKEIRIQNGLRQIDLATKLQEPQSYVSKYEKGERNLDLYQLKKICDGLNISLSTFVKKLESRITNESK